MTRKQRRKIRLYIWRVVFVALIVGAAVVGAKVALVQVELSAAVQRGDTSLGDVPVDAAAVYDKEIVNILLVGADKRESWNDTGRSDSTMIATVDLKNNQLKLSSLMRDMYVPIPGHDSNKFNAAYAFGGVPLLYQTIASNFNIRLDGYLVVDFKAFRQLIDGLGGVDISLTEDEADYLNTAYHGKLKVETGKQVLTGKEALAYCRIRQDVYGDFGRTKRQREVISSIFEKFKGNSFMETKDLAVELLGNVTTDLSDKQIFSLLTSVLSMGTTNVEQLCIPMDNSYSSQRISGAGAVLVPDMEANKAALQEFIFSPAMQAEAEADTNNISQ